MRASLFGLMLLCAMAAAAADTASNFTQYNATMYLYGNQTPVATWELLPFDTPVKQIVWWAPLDGFAIFFQNADPLVAKVTAEGGISVRSWPLTLLGLDGVAAVSGNMLYYVMVQGPVVWVSWCNETLSCSRFIFPTPEGFAPVTTVLDVDVLGLGSLVVGTNAGLVLLNATLDSSSWQWVPLFNTTGGVNTTSHISKVHVMDDGTILAASNENYTTVNAWTTDLVHVVVGAKETYFYRTPGIIDAIPTAFVRDPVRGGTHMGNMVCDNFLYANGTIQRISGAYEGGLPQRNITVGAWSAATNNIWFGTAFGVAMLRPDDTWKYFLGPRWLPGAGFTTGMSVRAMDVGLSVDGTEAVLVATDTGLSLIYTLTWQGIDAKASFYQSQVPRFLRYGLVSQLSLDDFGNTRQFVQTPTANDGLWTSLYLGSESFRYASTGDEDARQQAWNAFNGMQMLVNVTGDLSYPARNFIEHPTPCPSSYYPSTSMPGFCWTGGTSSDEIVGHLHGYALFYHLVAATPEEKGRVAATITNILGSIVKNNFTLIGGHSGLPTHWGHWGPASLNFDPFWYDERGVNSNQILTYLVTAYGITENPMFEEAFWYLVEQERYDLNIIDLKITQPSDINFSDDELTFLPYLSFLFGRTFANGTANPLYERIAPNVWQSIQRTHSIVAKEKPSLYNAIYAAAAKQIAGIPPTDGRVASAIADGVWWLHTYTVWQVDWPVNNAVRLDAVFPRVDMGRDGPGNGYSHTLTLFPYDELSMMRWNSNPFRTQQGSGYSELDPSPYLYAYWVGRYYNYW